MPKAEDFKGIWEIAILFSFYPILRYLSPHPPNVGVKNNWSVPKPKSTYFAISCKAGTIVLLNSGLSGRHQHWISKPCLISLLSYAFISQISKDSKMSFCDLFCCYLVSYCCHCVTWVFSQSLSKVKFLLCSFLHCKKEGSPKWYFSADSLLSLYTNYILSNQQ